MIAFGLLFTLFVWWHLDSNEHVTHDFKSNIVEIQQIGVADTKYATSDSNPEHFELIKRLASVDANLDMKQVEAQLNVKIRQFQDEHHLLRICVRDLSAAHVSTSILCYPRLFEPTYQLKPIFWAQEIPRGTHRKLTHVLGLYVRMDLQTGIREARMLKTPRNQPIKVHASMVPVVKDRETPVIVYKSELDPLMLELESKFSLDQNVQEQLIIMSKIEPLVENIHIGVKFMENWPLVSQIDHKTVFYPLEMILQLMAHADVQVSRSAAMIIGLSLENNPEAKAIATASQHWDLFHIFLHDMLVEQEETTRNEILFAFGSLVRENTPAVQMMFEMMVKVGEDSVETPIQALGHYLVRVDISPKFKKMLVELIDDIFVYVNVKEPEFHANSVQIHETITESAGRVLQMVETMAKWEPTKILNEHAALIGVSVSFLNRVEKRFQIKIVASNRFVVFLQHVSATHPEFFDKDAVLAISHAVSQ